MTPSISWEICGYQKEKRGGNIQLELQIASATLESIVALVGRLTLIISKIELVSHLSCQNRTDFPLPIIHLHPSRRRERTSLIPIQIEENIIPSRERGAGKVIPSLEKRAPRSGGCQNLPREIEKSCLIQNSEVPQTQNTFRFGHTDLVPGKSYPLSNIAVTRPNKVAAPYIKKL